jgi:hypothetical protein
MLVLGKYDETAAEDGSSEDESVGPGVGASHSHFGREMSSDLLMLEVDNTGVIEQESSGMKSSLRRWIGSDGHRWLYLRREWT